MSGLFLFCGVSCTLYYITNFIKNKNKGYISNIAAARATVSKQKSTKISAVVDDNKGFAGRVLPNVQITEIRLHDIPTLRDFFPSANILTQNENTPDYNQLIEEEDCVIYKIVRKFDTRSATDAFVRAGPRSVTHFDASKVKAAIVTCGGLCPGLNNVVRELVHSLHYLYQVESVLGIRFVIFDNMKLTVDKGISFKKEYEQLQVEFKFK